MIYNSWTVQSNILMRLSSVPHECWGCIDTFLFGAILVHARHRDTTGVLDGGSQPVLDCELGYCCICGIWLLFRVEGGLHFLYFWILDPGL